MITNPASRSSSAPTVLFLSLSVLTFIGVVATVTLVTFILPESFAGAARIQIEWRSQNTVAGADSRSNLDRYDARLIQTEIEVLHSELVLQKVIEQLDLNTVWGRKYIGVDKLKTAECLGLLKARLVLRTVQNASVIQICAFSDNPDEAAHIANAVARAYLDHTQAPTSSIKATLIDSARADPRSVRPNKPKNIILGILAGGVLGLTVGSLGAWLLRLWQRRLPRPPALP